MSALSDRISSAQTALSVVDRTFVDKLTSLHGYDRVFHPAVPNNEAFLFFPKAVNVDHCLQDIANQLMFLNESSCMAAKYCSQWLREQRSCISEEAYGPLSRITEAWIKNNNLGRFFLGAHAVDAFRKCLELAVPELGFAFPKYIADYILSEVNPSKTRITVQFCVKQYSEEKLLQHIIEKIREERMMSELIEKFEIRMVSKRNEARRRSASISAHLKNDLITMLGCNLLQEIEKLENTIDIEDNHSLAYTRRISSCMHLSQGFYGYKQFANAIGVLGEEYDQADNFAFLLGSSGDRARQLLAQVSTNAKNSGFRSAGAAGSARS